MEQTAAIHDISGLSVIYRPVCHRSECILGRRGVSQYAPQPSAAGGAAPARVGSSNFAVAGSFRPVDEGNEEAGAAEEDEQQEAAVGAPSDAALPSPPKSGGGVFGMFKKTYSGKL